ncbi:putative lipid II flippase FtsW [Candidatus Dependentiae bacterium]|nr:putative lipid II flippase FtsW [Candidatus Dependentiae bacterium]
MIENKKHTGLTVFVALIIIFVFIGLVFIYSSSSVYAGERFGLGHYFVKKQLMGCVLGAVGLLSFRFLPLHFIKKCTPLAFYASLILTGLTLVPKIGQSIHGSHRWIKLGGFSFQPSEMLKIAFLLYFAYLLDKKQYRLSSLIYGYLPLLCVLGVTSAILLKQPDFGQTVTLCITAFMLLFLADCNPKHLAATAGTLVPIGLILVVLKPYRLKRILTFLNPWADPRGAGFQIIQSLIAIGSGNLTGVGIAHSKQKFFYLPMQHTDFIFSIIAEETGFMGSTVLVGLYVAFLYYGLRLAQQCKTNFTFYVVAGFVLLTSLQAFVNISVATGLMPTKGLGLPFISYGVSALLSNLCMLGIVINCVTTPKESIDL